MEHYYLITYKNGTTRIMYGTEEQAIEHCKARDATYKFWQE